MSGKKQILIENLHSLELYIFIYNLYIYNILKTEERAKLHQGICVSERYYNFFCLFLKERRNFIEKLLWKKNTKFKK